MPIVRRVVEVLRRAVADGQLTVDELEERVPSAYAASTRTELERLTADLSVESLHDAARAATEAARGGVRIHASRARPRRHARSPQEIRNSRRSGQG
jgi:uncharacterized small protein (DUF1192 family)